jgi:predicted exporter
MAISRLAATDFTWRVWIRLLKLRQREDWTKIWQRLMEATLVPVPGFTGGSAALGGLDELLAAFARQGSNSAAVAGSKTTSGGAMIASDPHLAIVLRRGRDLALVLAPLALAVLFTAASAVLLGLRLNFANVIVLPLLFGLRVSGALHVVMRWREAGRLADIDATSTPRAVLLSALTTVASFGSLAISNHVGLGSMGLLLTIAIFWSLVCNLMILPSMLALAGRRG